MAIRQPELNIIIANPHQELFNPISTFETIRMRKAFQLATAELEFRLEL